MSKYDISKKIVKKQFRRGLQNIWHQDFQASEINFQFS